MKKRILSLLLALSLLSIPALAVENSTEHFTAVKPTAVSSPTCRKITPSMKTWPPCMNTACLWDRLTALTVSPGT